MKWWNHRVYNRKAIRKSSNHFTAKKLMVSKETGLTHGDVTYNIGGGSGVTSKVIWLLQLRDFFSSSWSSLADWHSEIPWRPLSCLLGSTASVVSSWVPTTIPNHCPAGIHALPRWFPDTPRSPAWLSAAAEEAGWDSLSIALNYHDSVMSCFTDKASGLGYWSFLQSTPYPPNHF